MIRSDLDELFLIGAVHVCWLSKVVATLLLGLIAHVIASKWNLIERTLINFRWLSGHVGLGLRWEDCPIVHTNIEITELFLLHQLGHALLSLGGQECRLLLKSISFRFLTSSMLITLIGVSTVWILALDGLLVLAEVLEWLSLQGKWISLGELEWRGVTVQHILIDLHVFVSAK